MVAEILRSFTCMYLVVFKWDSEMRANFTLKLSVNQGRRLEKSWKKKLKDHASVHYGTSSAKYAKFEIQGQGRCVFEGFIIIV